jgi:hypothetical protein
MRVCSKHTTTIRDATGGVSVPVGRGRGGRGGQPGMGVAASEDPAHAAFPASSVTRTETRGDGFCTSQALPQQDPEAAEEMSVTAVTAVLVMTMAVSVACIVSHLH